MLLALSLLATAPATPHSLTVPFFDDGGGVISGNGPVNGGFAGFVTTRNTRGEPLVMYLVYSQPDPQGEAVQQQAVSFTLAAYKVVNFRPATDDPAEGPGRSVPNMLPGLGTKGSVQIIWIGGPEMASGIVGRYEQFNSINAFAHVLLADRW